MISTCIICEDDYFDHDIEFDCRFCGGKVCKKCASDLEDEICQKCLFEGGGDEDD